jgi:hypothetical protein
VILSRLDHAEFTKCPIFIEILASARKKWPIHIGFFPRTPESARSRWRSIA